MGRVTLGSMVLAMALALAACEPMEEPGVDHQTELDELGQAYVEAYNRQDAHAVAEFYTTDAYFVDADGTEARGRDQLRQHVEQIFMQARPQLTVSPVETDGEQGLAWQYGTYQVQIQPTAAQPAQPGQQPAQPGQQPQQMQSVQGRYLIVLEREDDSWLIRAHMNNVDMPEMPGMMPPDRLPVDTPPARPPVDTPPEAPVDTPQVP